MVAGCARDDEPPRRFVPGEPLYEQFTTRGNRVVVESPEKGPTLKVRTRATHTKVYDERFISVGQVRPAGEEFEARSRDGQIRRSTRWIDDDTAELPDGWRIERVDDDGWDVFSGDGTLLALWRRSDDQDQWTMRTTDAEAQRLSVELDRRSRVVDADGNIRLEARVSDWSSIKFLALTLDKITPLERYTLAMWADKNL